MLVNSTGYLNEVIPLCHLNIYFITICFRQHNWLLFFHFVTFCRGWGFFLLSHSHALLPVSAHSIGSVFILFSLVFQGGCRLL